MRNTVLENEIQSTLSKSFESLKGFIKSYEIFPIFFLLKKLNKDFDKIVSLSNNQSHLEVYRQLYKSLSDNDPRLPEAFSVFEDAFAEYSSVHWPTYFQKIPLQTLSQEEFEIYFEQSLILSRKKDSYSEYSTPKEIAEFITSVYSVDENAKVFNPFGGNASLANYFPPKIKYAGNEINRRAWALGILNLAAHNRLENSDFICKDSFNDSRKEKPFDFVISNLPFGLRKPYSNHTIPNEVDGDAIFFAIRQIAKNGKAVFLTTTSFLSNSNRNAKELRKNLIERDILEYVVLLPSKLFSNTSIPSVAIFINTSPNKKGGVTVIDASEFVLPDGKRNKILDSGRLLELIEDERDGEFKRWVTREEIIEQDYNFNVRRYLLDNEATSSEYKTVRLGDIVKERIREKSIDPGTVGKFIRIRDLKSEIIDCNIALKDIEVTEIPLQASEVKYASLLLALRFKTLKPTLIGFSGEKAAVYLSNDILNLKVDETHVDVAYLVSELNSDYVLKQVKSLQYGSTIPSIRIKDVLNLKIRLPEKEQQRKLFQAQLEAFYHQKDKELKAFKNQFDIQSDVYKEFSSLKHSLGTPLLNVGSSILSIKALISKSADEAIKKELTIILESATKNLKFINNLLQQNENGLDLNNYQVEEVELFEYTTNYIKTLPNYSFTTLILVSDEVFTNFDNKICINSNLDLLQVLFNNILQNAEMHAFKKQKKDENVLCIKIEVNTDTSNVIVSFKNNGLPFPENFDKEKFIRKNSKAGDTGNTGIGGYDINRIVNFMQGTFDLKLNEEIEFPTIYEIQFPIINTKENTDEEL